MTQLDQRYVEDELRYALAMNRGIQMLDPATKLGKEIKGDFAKFFTPTANHTATPDEVFYRLHQELFAEWRKREPHGAAAPTVADSEKRGEISKIIREFLWDPETGLLDNNNAAVTMPQGQLEEKLAKFHKAITDLRPFAYASHLTAEFFLTALFDQGAMEAVYPQGIDFRRLTDKDRQVLRDPQSTEVELRDAFCNAMDVTRTPVLNNPRNGFGSWKQSSEQAGEIKFLAYHEQDQTYVVTVNGGLVPINQVQELMIEHRRNNALGLA